MKGRYTCAEQKAVLTLGSIWGLAVGSAAGAQIHYSTDGFTVNKSVASCYWDIDGDGGAEMRLKYFSYSSGQGNHVSSLRISILKNSFGLHLNTGKCQNYFTCHGKESRFQILSGVNTAQKVGQNIVGFFPDGSTSFQNTNVLVLHNSAIVADGFTGAPATGYIAFKFNNAGVTCYGWAEVMINAEFDNGYLTIERWAYSSDYIQVGAVPEPAQTAFGLGALALGVAGISRWRRSKAAARA
jgi:hypothetical protein